MNDFVENYHFFKLFVFRLQLRNLCYMIVRREKLRKEIHRTAMETFYKQNDILLEFEGELPEGHLELLRHRATHFSDFSNNYVTEEQYKLSHGIRANIFDSSSDGDTLLDTSCDEKDIKLEVPSSSSSPRVSKSDKEITSSVNNERNIFDLLDDTVKDNEKEHLSKVTLDHDEKFVPEERLEPSNEKEPNDEKEPLPVFIEDDEISFPKHENTQLHVKVKKKKQTLINFKPVAKHNTEHRDLFDNLGHLLDNNGIRDDAVVENGHSTSGVVDDFIGTSDSKVDKCSTQQQITRYSKDYQLNNGEKFKASVLQKKGKKRFRNLHSATGSCVRRNSPRLKNLTENHLLVSDVTAVQNDVIEDFLVDEQQKPSVCNGIDQESKRRRLNSCGESLTENEDELSAFASARITRSSVSSCS